MASGSSRKKKQRSDEESVERIRATAATTLAKLNLLRTGLIGLCCLGGLALCIPIAHVLAGKETGLDVNVAISFTIAVSIAGLTAGGIARQQKLRAEQAEERVRRLENDLAIANDVAKTAQEQRSALQRDLDGVRADIEALRGSRP